MSFALAKHSAGSAERERKLELARVPFEWRSEAISLHPSQIRTFWEIVRPSGLAIFISRDAVRIPEWHEGVRIAMAICDYYK